MNILKKEYLLLIVLVSNSFNIYSDETVAIDHIMSSYGPILTSIISSETKNNKLMKSGDEFIYLINETVDNLPIEYSIKDDDNFVYIKIKSKGLKDWPVESKKRGNGIVINIDSPQMKIYDVIDSWDTSFLIEKKICDSTEKCESEFSYRLPARVDLTKDVHIKKIKEENCVLITLEKNEDEKIYRIKVDEE